MGLRIISALGPKTRSWLARAADLPESTIGDAIKRGPARSEVALKIAGALNVSLDWLLTGKGPTQSQGTASDEAVAVDQTAFVKAMAARIRTLAETKGLGPSALGDAADIKRSSMTYYWRGDRPYPVEALAAIAGKLSTTVNFLLVGQHGDAEAEFDLVPVSEIDLSYGLGGTFADAYVDVQTHHFPRVWLERITTTPPALLTFARGRGDSMQPTLQDGDMVLIDRSVRTIREQDAMWAITIGEIAMIKRIRVRGERVFILSDNDRVPADEAHHEEVNVVGRVIFIGRMI